MHFLFKMNFNIQWNHLLYNYIFKMNLHARCSFLYTHFQIYFIFYQHNYDKVVFRQSESMKLSNILHNNATPSNIFTSRCTRTKINKLCTRNYSLNVLFSDVTIYIQQLSLIDVALNLDKFRSREDIYNIYN